MGFGGELVNILKDSKHIADKQSGPGAGRLQLWLAYVKLRLFALVPNRVHTDLLSYQIRFVDPSSMLQLYQEIFVDRLYDVPLSSESPRIIDCGSNIGISILFFKNLYPRASIIGFEPHPIVFRTLSDNVERNGLDDVILHQKALSDRTGMTELFVSANAPGALNMSLFAAQGQTPINVECTRLSTYVESGVDLLKLDVEGSEELVLTELAQANKLRFVSNIVCEYHHHRAGRSDRLSKTLSILEEAGFGYQIGAYRSRYAKQPYHQDVMIYAYRRHATHEQP